MPGVFMTCAATSGNGATTFTRWTITRRRLGKIPEDRPMVKRKLFAAAPGDLAPRVAGPGIAITRILDTRMFVSDMTSMVFVASERRSRKKISRARRAGSGPDALPWIRVSRAVRNLNLTLYSNCAWRELFTHYRPHRGQARQGRCVRLQRSADW